ncbi:MAG: FMN-binding protein [Firmicutes bacterium]|nr:FMN-binding protein [Bacillota bacterium]
MNASIRMILVLTLIAAVAAGLLAGINAWTEPIIEENTAIRLQETLAKVIDADEFVEEEIEDRLTMWLANKGGDHVGYVVQYLGGGYSSAGINVLVGIDTAGAVTGVEIFAHSETPGLGDKIENPSWLQRFEGQDFETGIDVDNISGATASAQGVIGSVRNALEYVALYAGLLEPPVEIDFGEIPDGTYTGTGRGFGGDITVEVTIADGRLAEVVVLSHSDTPGYVEPALDAIPDRMVDEQQLDVDIVSGSTASSNGIINAVRDALSEFVGEELEDVDIEALASGRYIGTASSFGGDLTVEVAVAGGKITDITVLSHTDTEDIAEPAFEEVIERMLNEQSLEVDLVSGATISAEALLLAVENALRGTVIIHVPDLSDGVYVGEAEGFSGQIRVAVTVEAGEITGIEIVDHSDTPEIANPAFDEMIDAVLESQALDVDFVSGATISCEGFIEAIREAFLSGPQLEISAVPDGEYTGRADGFYDEIEVRVVVAGGEISEIEVTEEQDTPEIARPAFEQTIERIINAQSLDVDNVSGATISVNGLLDAVETALRSAGE